MKKILLLLMLNVFLFEAFSQTDCQSFTGLSKEPTDWFVGGGAQIRTFNDPANNCASDVGLQTPGVGGANPTRIIQNTRTFSTNTPYITSSFDIFVFDANTNCASAKEFPCETFVKVYLVKSTFTSTNTAPSPSDIYAETEYKIVTANGSNTFVFSNPSIPNGATYRVVYDFKAPSNCVQGNTKYILDDVCTTLSNCAGNCPPYANNDYFDANVNPPFLNNLKANVLGGFASWASQLSTSRPGYDRKSLSSTPAVSNGTDGDNDNHPLSAMTFTLLSGPTVVTSAGCSGTPPSGTLIWNGDGSFEYTRANICVERVQFTYRIIDPTALQSGIATVTIDFPPNIVTPVKLKSFTAARRQSNVELKWVTTLEQNNYGFEVQRQAGAGGWQTVAFVKSQAANGNSTSDLTYTYTDLNDSKGISQYRLRQVDLDDVAKYSDIRTVQGMGQNGKTIISPNPSTNGMVNVTFEAVSKRDMQLTDMNGRMIRQWNAYNENSLQLNNLTPGIYQLRIVDRESGTQSVEKIMVVNR